MESLPDVAPVERPAIHVNSTIVHKAIKYMNRALWQKCFKSSDSVGHK